MAAFAKLILRKSAVQILFEGAPLRVLAAGLVGCTGSIIAAILSSKAADSVGSCFR